MDLREHAISGLVGRIAHENIGIYCKSWQDKDGKTVERGPYHDGWNACSMAHSRNASAAHKFLDALTPETRPLIEDLLLEEKLNLSIRDGAEPHLWVICNDVFAWGCADGEDIAVAEIPALAE